MRENRFIDQNKQKWQDAESLLTSEVKDPEKLGNLFVQVVDDLSYSRTYYPNRSVRVYLNKIARQYFSIIYGHRKTKQSPFKLFWLDELPQLMLFTRREMLLSLAVFLMATAIGVFSAAKDPQFTATILGDSYVAMTNKNIQSGDPMAVYKKSHQVDMFLGITFNNLMVAFRTYVLGIFIGIGTLGSLLFNGVMLGSFQYYFAERGLFFTSASSIWLHGTLEISSVILAGGAGFTLARGLIFPGTYSRLQSLQISGIRSLKIMLGITPVFVLAAVIESFLTRYTEAPAILKLVLIFLSAVFIVGYFVVYPWLKSKTGFAVPLKEQRLQAASKEPVNFTSIKTNAELLKDTFQFYARHSARILPWIVVVSLAVTACFFVFEEPVYIITEQDWWIALFGDMLFAMSTPSPVFILTNALATALVFYRVMKLVDVEFKKSTFAFNLKAFLQTVVFTALIFGAVYINILGILFVIGAFGVLTFSAFVQLTEQSNLGYGFARGWALFGRNNSQGVSLQFTVLLLSFSFLLLLSAPVLYIHMSVIKWNFVATDEWSQKAIHFVELFIRAFSFYLTLPLIAASLAYLYFSQEEVDGAAHLKESISKMESRVSKNKRR